MCWIGYPDNCTNFRPGFPAITEILPCAVLVKGKFKIDILIYICIYRAALQFTCHNDIPELLHKIPSVLNNEDESEDTFSIILSLKTRVILIFNF